MSEQDYGTLMLNFTQMSRLLSSLMHLNIHTNRRKIQRHTKAKCNKKIKNKNTFQAMKIKCDFLKVSKQTVV